MDSRENPQSADAVTPPVDHGTTADEQAVPTIKDWLLGNSISVTLVGMLFLFILYQLAIGKIDLSTLVGFVEVGIGLGFVIFFHELGHFLVAKWCDVHVQTFSIGFGPAIPGCSFQWGETTYKLAIFPLGGYVKMVGQVDGDESDDSEAEADPRSYRNKTVWQRMGIISAGVVMNVILACVCFVAVYTHGVKREPAGASFVESGGRAWEKGITGGATFVQIGDTRKPHGPSFMDLKRAVIRSKEGEKVRMIYQYPPGTESFDVLLEPRVSKGLGFPAIGISPANSVALIPQSLAPDQKHPVRPLSPAAAARKAFDLHPGDRIVATTDPDQPSQTKPLPAVEATDDKGQQAYARELHARWMRLAGKPMTIQVRRHGSKPDEPPAEIATEPAAFHFEDTILATTDPEQRDKVTPLPFDVHNPGSGLGDFFAFDQRMQRLAGEYITIRVRRTKGEEVDVVVPPSYHVSLGVRMSMGAIAAIRENSPGQEAGVHKDDILQEVILTAKDGAQARFVTAHKKDETPADLDRFVDPMRLPFELRKWAEGKQGVKATLIVFRTDPTTREERGKPQALPAVNWSGSERWRFSRERPSSKTSPMSIAELGIAYKVETTVEKGGPAGEGQPTLEQDDVIKQIRFRIVKEDGQIEQGKWSDLGTDQWAYPFTLLQESVDVKRFTLQVERKKKAARDAQRKTEAELSEVEIEAQPDVTWPDDDRGLFFKPDSRILRADGLWQAIMLGLTDTYDQIWDVYYNITGMMSGRISHENIGGPIMIGTYAYRLAKVDFWEFLFFLGAISVNLAVINFLPIPVLDGGHMVFLTYEKLRGRPASEPVRVAATYVGLLLILSLMVFVFYLDIKRIWF